MSSLYALPRVGASMSSLYESQFASICIDDDVLAENWCETSTEANPWVLIDLGTSYNVDWVQIYNRNDNNGCGSRLGYYEVSTSTDDLSYTLCALAGSGTSIDCDVATDPGPGPFTVPCTATARYVKVTLPGSERILNLNEVYVMAASPKGSNRGRKK